ncbi:MAG: hypothetical protein R3E87_15860 [Burkholderiaceae bacterium]
MNTYFDAFDHRRALADYPIGPAFDERMRTLSADALRALQERRFARLLARAWQVPFYRRLWGAQGIETGDIRGLDDLPRLPRFTKTDIMASIEAHPPLGDFHGVRPGERMILHTTSGTTGRPQTLLFGPTSREIQNILLARAYRMQGLCDDDVVQSVYGFGMINGGHYIRETLLHYTRALLLPAGTGAETRSAQQVALMRDFRVTVLLGFADYIRTLAQIARQHGLEPGRDIPVRLILGHMGRESKDEIGALWGGAQVYDWYGVGDTGIIAAEGPDREGLHLFEDAHVVEIVDPATGTHCADGEDGNLVTTVLFKDDVYPIIRFDTQDVTHRLPGTSPLAWPLGRIVGFRGRSDNMVKLRGINVYPHAISARLGLDDGCTGEYICRLRRDDQGREQMLVEIETTRAAEATLADALRARLRAALGVAVGVRLVAPGALAETTGIESRQKAIRLIDERTLR